MSLCGLEYFRSYYQVIPIEFLNSYSIPCVSIDIESNKYLVEIDFGAKTALILNKDVLEKVNKVPCGTSSWMDYSGNKYNSLVYFIPEVKLGSLLVKKIKAKEESSQFAEETSVLVKTKESKFAGRIGRDFFSGKNILMDFSHHGLILCSRLDDFRKRGGHNEPFTTVPFVHTSEGVVLQIDTDLGKQKFVLDTGSTVSVIRSKKTDENHTQLRNGMPVLQSMNFCVGGTNFGPFDLYLLDINQEFKEAEGLLGMDFLVKHIVYLDFGKKIAYISSETK